MPYRDVPYDIEVEQALLGAILLDNSRLKAAALLKPEHFYDQLHLRLFEAIRKMVGDLTVNPLTLHAVLKADGGLHEVGGHAYLIGLVQAAPALPNVRDFVRILRGLAFRRELIRVGEHIVNNAIDAPIERSPLLQLQAGEKLLADLREGEAEQLECLLPVIDMALWEGMPTPERRWHVRDRIPGRNVTLLSGEGSIGKTLVAEQLSAATVLGKDWLGTTPAQGPALLVCCEDDADEMHIRFARIAAYYGATFADLRNDLHLISLVGRQTVIAEPDRAGLIQPTPLFHEIRRLANRINPALIVLDNSADMFAGNENDRAQVRQFIAWLRRLAVEVDAAVVLTSHPSVRGADTGSGISGSTAWHASVRGRLYMRRPKVDRNQQADPDERVLEVMKSNYGPAGEIISLRWQEGLFLPSGVHWTDKRAAAEAADELFMRLLANFEDQGRNVSHKLTSPTYAPTAFASDPEAQVSNTKKAAFAQAMHRLFSDGRIRVEQYGRPSRPYEKLVMGQPK